MQKERDWKFITTQLDKAQREAQRCWDGTNSESDPAAPAWLYMRGYLDWLWEIQLIEEEMKAMFYSKMCDCLMLDAPLEDFVNPARHPPTCSGFILSEAQREKLDQNPSTDTPHRQQPMISRSDYIARFRAEMEHLIALTNAKNADYAVNEDALQNFRLIEHLTGGKITTDAGMLTRISDKVQRVMNLWGGATTNFESIADNLDDLAVYAIILKIHLGEGRG